MKYYKTEFIPKFSNDEESISEKMMEHIEELIELEYAIELDGEKYIVLNDEDELDESISKIENDGKLFVRSGIFLSRNNQRILEERLSKQERVRQREGQVTELLRDMI